MPRAEPLRIGLAQLNPTVGDYAGNALAIRQCYLEANAAGLDLLLTPELSLIGYPLMDLAGRRGLAAQLGPYLRELIKLTQNRHTVLGVGVVDQSAEAVGRALYNTVVLLGEGRVLFRQAKTLLPTYDVFDETRHFAPAPEIRLWEHFGRRIAIGVCEDLWAAETRYGRRLYPQDPVDQYARLGADLILVCAASPFEQSKAPRRESLHARVVQKLGVPLVYVNQVGATDDILFDGASFGLDSQGTVQARAKSFETQVLTCTVVGDELRGPSAIVPEAPPAQDLLIQGLTLGIQDYCRKTGFKRVHLGLSGGIDSAVVAVLAAQALSPAQVQTVAMPGPYSSERSLTDARQLAEHLQVGFEVHPIAPAFALLQDEFCQTHPGMGGVAFENLQARLRSVILMTLSNAENSLVLTTGNKSEISLGYTTLYGDMSGALTPIGDLYKTEVYALSRSLNERFQGVIPEAILQRAPSAELRLDQKDEDTLPPYAILDAILYRYLEDNMSLEEIQEDLTRLSQAEPGNPSRVDAVNVCLRRGAEILATLERNEFKRRQAALCLKVSAQAYGLSRRIPIAKRWCPT